VLIDGADNSSLSLGDDEHRRSMGMIGGRRRRYPRPPPPE
jgi:hypothetical protein